MTGSRKWFVYTTDAGTDFGIQLDESNTEQVNGATQDLVPGVNILYAVPRNIKPRKCVFESTDGHVRREIVALTTTIYGGLALGSSYTDPSSNTTVYLVRKVGEISTIPRPDDTGLNDGDLT